MLLLQGVVDKEPDKSRGRFVATIVMQVCYSTIQVCYSSIQVSINPNSRDVRWCGVDNEVSTWHDMNYGQVRMVSHSGW